MTSSTTPHSAAGGAHRLGLVTGASGYVGGELVGRLLDEGWRVRVLTRHRSGLDAAAWADRIAPAGRDAARGEVEVVEGDAASERDLARALDGVEVAWYLLHSMGDVDDFERAEREMAEGFARQSRAAETRRLVYLGGLHPDGGELSAHLRSRGEVGRILLGSGVPTAALSAGVVVGAGSSSFRMLQGLAERLPGAFGPRWLRNEITPIAVRDLLHYLVRAADLPEAESRAFDIGGPDTLPYAAMLARYARVAGRGHRPVLTIPVMTPRMASLWIAMVTGIPRGLVRPIVESILHDTVVKERDLEALVGAPAGGALGFDDAVREATRGRDLRRWRRILAQTGGAVALTALIGSAATNPGSRWYRGLRKPSFQPPAWAFPVAWTALYALIAAMGSLARMDLAEAHEMDGERDADDVRSPRWRYDLALAVNLLLNAGWSAVFFRGKRLGAATAVAAALAASSADLAARTGATAPERGVLLAPYAAWTAFATALTGAIAALNRGGRGRTTR